MKLRGKKVVEVLRGMAEGESALVDSDEWTNLGGEFERAADHGVGDAEIVRADDLQAWFDDGVAYNVRR